MDKLDVWNIAMHIAALPHCHLAKLTKWSRQESNLNPGLRRPLYYPLYYETVRRRLQRYDFTADSANPGLNGHRISPPTFVANIFTAIASSTTPKNFRTASNPAGPSSRAIAFNDRSTTKTISRLIRIPASMIQIS